VCSYLHRLHYALPGWDTAAERRDAQDEFHSAAQSRAWAALSTAWTARLISARRAASSGWRRRLCARPCCARAHYVASSAATPLPLNIRRAAISGGHAITRTTAVVSTCEPPRIRFRPGEGKCQPSRGAHVRACTRRLTCPILLNVNAKRQ
jgi:hypothetical protein